MKSIWVYCDGSSTGKADGPCGWGWLVVNWTDDEIVCAGSEGAASGTNNIAELQGAIHGLRAVFDRKLHVGGQIVLVSDSTYCLNMATGAYKATKYHDTINTLQALMNVTRAKTQWIRGHSGDAFNDRCDQLAKMGRDRYAPTGKKKLHLTKKREIRRYKRRIVKAWKKMMYSTTYP